MVFYATLTRLSLIHNKKTEDSNLPFLHHAIILSSSVS